MRTAWHRCSQHVVQSVCSSRSQTNIVTDIRYLKQMQNFQTKRSCLGKERGVFFLLSSSSSGSCFHGQNFTFTFWYLMLMNIMPWSSFLFCLFSHFFERTELFFPPTLCTRREFRCVQITMSDLWSAHSLTHTVSVLYEVCVKGCVVALFWWKRFWPGAGLEGLRCVRVAEITSVKAQLQL